MKRTTLRLPAPASWFMFWSALVLWSCGGSPPAAPVPEAAPPRAAGVRLLLIGIDAADEQAMDPLAAAGALPNLSALRERGASGPLRSHLPMLSPILWTSIATGVSPVRHGVLDFVEADDRGGVRPIGSASRQAAAIWDILGRSDWTVGVVGWLATWPAPPVNGWLVSDRLTVHPFEPVEAEPAKSPEGKTWPPIYFNEVLPLVVAPGSVSDAERHRIFGTAPLPPSGTDWTAQDERTLQVVAASTRTHRDIGVELARLHSPGFLAVYFDGIDRLSHVFSDVAETPLSGSDPRRVVRYGHVIENYWREVDAAVGALVDAAGPQAIVLVVSDHGWKTGALRPRTDPRRDGPFAAEWHREDGIVIVAGPGVARGRRLSGADLYDIAPTLLAIAGLPASREMTGRVLGAAFDPGALPPVPAGSIVQSWGAPSQAPPSLESRPIPGQATAPGDGPGSPGSESEAAAALETLRGLGYIAAPAAGSPAVSDRRRANLAGVMLDEGKNAEAARLLESFLVERPDDYDALFNLAVARRRMNDPAASARAYERAAALRPGAAEPVVALGELAANAGRPDEAARWSSLALRLDPSNAACRNLAGVVAVQRKDFREGIIQFQRALELDRSSPSAWINLARTLAAAGRSKDAARTLRDGLIELPGNERLMRKLEEIEKVPAGNPPAAPGAAGKAARSLRPRGGNRDRPGR